MSRSGGPGPGLVGLRFCSGCPERRTSFPPEPLSRPRAWLATGIGSIGASIGLLRSANADFDLAPNGQQPASRTAGASGADARTVWRTLLAIAGPPLAIYVAVARFLLPYEMSDSPEVIFEKLVAHPGFTMISLWAGAVLGTTCLAGVVAVGWLSRRRVPMLTTIGLTLAVVGYTCLAIGNSFGELSTALVASHPEVDRATAYALGSGLELGPVSSVTGTLFVFGHLIGTIILGLALWRSHAVPTWAACCSPPLSRFTWPRCCSAAGHSISSDGAVRHWVSRQPAGRCCT